jgi:hypothetical protein
VSSDYRRRVAADPASALVVALEKRKVRVAWMSTLVARRVGYYDFALAARSMRAPAACRGSWYVSEAGGLYVVADSLWAFRRAGVGAYQIAPQDVRDRVARGEWRQVVNPHLQLRWMRLRGRS